MSGTLRGPNTFLIGAPKCGTTALMSYLADHPEVYVSTPKEPFYWAKDLPAAPHELRPGSLEEYLEMFAAATPEQSVLAEGSTSYLRSVDAVPEILKFNPEARFIVMLRNPVEVVQAFHMEQLYSQHEDVEDFAEAWTVQEARERGEQMPKRSEGGDFVLYRRAATFSDQIARFYAAVPEDQRLTILFDDFKTDTAAVYRRTLAFLGLPDDGRESFEKVNASHAQRFPGLARFVLYPPKPLERPMRALRKALLDNPPPGIAQLKAMMNVKKDRSAVAPEVLADIRAYFAPEVTQLETLIGQDLSPWRQP